ncbi:MAG: hypothetical protein EPO40_33885 [Myxococcaceae bacterium]|nr:MAG: hypothetical protein EPO40_33885 [Myxococcaceae bacterium]
MDVPSADVGVARDVPTADIPRPPPDAPAADVGVVRDVLTAVDAPGIPADGGAPGAWELIGNFDNGLWQWGPYLAAAPDGTVYVARSRVGVYRGTLRDGRYTFDLLPTTGLTNLILSSLGVNDLGEPLLGCWGAMYGASGPGSIFRFNRAAGSWVASTIPAPGYTRSASDFLVARDGSVFATGGWAAVLLRSTDHGDTFSVAYNFDAEHPGDRYGFLFSVAVGPGDEMFVGAETASFQHSFDNGRTFTPVDTAPWGARGNPYGAGFTQSGDALFSRNIDADPTKIYRRDAARGWVRADLGLERDDFNHSSIAVWVHNILLAPWGENFIVTGTSIYRSRNGGAWGPFTVGIDTAMYRVVPNAIASDGRCIYVGLQPVAARTDIGAAYRYCGR